MDVRDPAERESKRERRWGKREKYSQEREERDGSEYRNTGREREREREQRSSSKQLQRTRSLHII